MSTSTVLRMGNVGYASVAPPKPPLKSIKPIPTRPLEPFKEPPVDIILPRVPTIRTDSQSSQPASEPGVSEANSSSTVLLYPPLTFHSTSSKIDSKGAAYRLTTHLFPSAYPRSPFLSGSTPIDTAEYERIGKVEEKEVRERMLAEYKAVLQRWADEINNAVEDGSKGKKGQHDAQSYDSICAAQKRVMWNSVNRIVREDSDGGSSYPSGPRLTLFFAHANGFPKEVGHFCTRNHTSADFFALMVFPFPLLYFCRHGNRLLKPYCRSSKNLILGSPEIPALSCP